MTVQSSSYYATPVLSLCVYECACNNNDIESKCVIFLQDGFVVRIFATSTEPVLQQELQLKLARKCLHACGISLFDLEKDLHIISKKYILLLFYFNFISVPFSIRKMFKW